MKELLSERILYEDNHLIAINKRPGDIVQKDITGDKSLSDEVADYLKKKYNKPGDAFIGVPHRIDRPVSGVVLFAKTSKALSRLSVMFRDKKLTKTYYAIVRNKPKIEKDTIRCFITRDQKKNKAFCHINQVKDSKEAILHYELVASSDRYYLLKIDLETGRHHQIRSQLAFIGCPIKGDLKYGFDRSNKDGGIDLHAGSISFEHPVKKENIIITAPFPEDPLWDFFRK